MEPAVRIAVTSSDAQHDQTSCCFSPLRHRDFRLFWTGLLLSSVGSQFTTVAMAWQIYELTNSPLQIGLIGLVRAVPQMAMLLFGGLFADAMNRRRLMMITQASLFLVSGALALSHFGREGDAADALRRHRVSGVVQLRWMRRRAMPSSPIWCRAEDLSRALAISSTQRQIATIAGPSIAGLVLAVAGPALCYAVDAISWLIMLARWR